MKYSRILSFMLLFSLLLCTAAPVKASADNRVTISGSRYGDTDTAKVKDTTKAKDITKRVSVKAKPKCNLNSVVDGKNTTRASLKKNTVLTCSAKQAVGGLYIETESPAGKITVTAGESTVEAEENDFLHFYVGGFEAKKFTVTFHNAVSVTDIRFLTKGVLPDWVQIWEPAPEQCDIMIMATHYDDDTLYFGGIAPWAIDQGASVMVAYYCDHRSEPYRKHEMLDGVWAAGIHSYPVFGSYFDSGLVDLGTAIAQLTGAGITWEDLLKRQVEIYRKYKPQIVLTHSMTGEYGHPQHILYELISSEAALMSGNADQFPDLTEKYGAHTVPKIYIHNYDSSSGKIVLDLDRPLESFGGKTPYEITVTAFRKHKTQVSGFIGWLTGPGSARNIGSYSPCEWGLFYSHVGNDTSTDTFFDNITLIKDQQKTG